MLMSWSLIEWVDLWSWNELIFEVRMSWSLKLEWVDLWSCEDVPLLTSCPFQLQISGEKWRRKSRRSWSCTRSWRRLVRLQHLRSRRGEACPLWSFSFRPHLQLHLHLQHRHRLQPCPQPLASAADTAVLKQEPAATSGQLPTKLPWQRQPPPPVLPVLSSSIPLRHLLPGGAGWWPLRGRSQPSPPSMWTALPHQHHHRLHHQHQHHHRLLRLRHLLHIHHLHYRHRHLHCAHFCCHAAITWTGSERVFGPARRERMCGGTDWLIDWLCSIIVTINAYPCALSGVQQIKKKMFPKNNVYKHVNQGTWLFSFFRWFHFHIHPKWQHKWNR